MDRYFHLILLASVNLTSNPLKLPADGNGATFDLTKIGQLKKENPNLKIIAAFGGWGLDDPFRPAVQTNRTRAVFAQEVATFLNTTGFDGADMDWE